VFLLTMAQNLAVSDALKPSGTAWNECWSLCLNFELELLLRPTSAFCYNNP